MIERDLKGTGFGSFTRSTTRRQTRRPTERYDWSARMRKLSVSLVVLSMLPLLGCSSPSRSAAPRSLPPIVASAQPEPAAAPWFPSIALPAATDVIPIPADAYPIWIDDTQAYLGLPAVPVVQLPPKAARAGQGFGIDKKPSPNDGFVNPLADAIERRSCGPDGRVPDAAVLYASAAMEYRVVIDALYTLSRLGYRRVFLATSSSTSGPSRVGLRLPGRDKWQLALFVHQDGFDLSSKPTGGEPLECPGAPPSKRRGLDIPALGTCVKAIAPEGAQIYLSPDGDLPLQTVVSVLESIGGRRIVVTAFPTSQPAVNPERKVTSATHVGNPVTVVTAMRQPFRDCYNQALATTPDAEGTIRLTMKVSADGTVSDTAATVKGKLGSAVECVRAVAARAKFEPPEGGSAVIVVPVTFVRTERGTPGAPRCGQSVAM